MQRDLFSFFGPKSGRRASPGTGTSSSFGDGEAASNTPCAAPSADDSGDGDGARDCSRAAAGGGGGGAASSSSSDSGNKSEQARERSCSSCTTTTATSSTTAASEAQATSKSEGAAAAGEGGSKCNAAATSSKGNSRSSGNGNCSSKASRAPKGAAADAGEGDGERDATVAQGRPKRPRVGAACDVSAAKAKGTGTEAWHDDGGGEGVVVGGVANGGFKGRGRGKGKGKGKGKGTDDDYDDDDNGSGSGNQNNNHSHDINHSGNGNGNGKIMPGAARSGVGVVTAHVPHKRKQPSWKKPPVRGGRHPATPSHRANVKDTRIPEEESDSAESSSCGSDSESSGSDDDSDGSESDEDSKNPESNEQELCEYEKQRLQRKKENQEALAQLGISAAMSAMTPKAQTKDRKPKPKREKRVVEITHRYRTRSTGKILPTDQAAATKDNNLPPQKRETMGIETESDSLILKYRCENTISDTNATRGAIPSNAHLIGFKLVSPGTHFVDPKLTRIYSMSYSHAGDVLAAGGHGGRVAIWPCAPVSRSQNCPNESESDMNPLVSFQAHRGWISDVQWLSDNSHPDVLLSSGNDGAVMLWDVHKSSAKSGSLVMRSKVSIGSGIFSFHEYGGTGVAGTKSAHVVVLRIGSANLEVVNKYDNVHTSVVKCAHLNSMSGMILSGGNDAKICLFDPRNSTVCGTFLRKAIVNYVEWEPASEYRFLSVALDKIILLHDSRRLDKPVFEYTGHTHSIPNTIRSARFVHRGRAIVTGGDTHELSLYCTDTGATVSRGLVGYESGSMESQGPDTLTLAVTHARNVHIFEPVWKP
ncbi:Peroxisome biogenesis protein 7 [Pelomyxa schiedti]|nr:Peroxisome biogenesis protein 7 [Pelomyxa schiedti]